VSETLRSDAALAFLREQQASVRAETATLQKKREEHEALAAHCARQCEEAYFELAGILLPSLAPATLDAVAVRLKLPAIASEVARKLLLDREAELIQLRDTLAADPRLPRVEGLLNACDIRLAEVNESLGSLRAGLSAFDGEPMFDELLRVGYGTPSYDTPWWRASYYRHWKNADTLVELWQPRLGVDTFPKLLEIYQEQRRAAQTLAISSRDLQSERSALVELATRHAEAVKGLAALPAWYEETLRGRVVERLRTWPERTPFELVEGPEGSAQNAVVAAKKISALEAKSRYLEQAKRDWIDKPMQELQRIMEKLARAEAKAQRKGDRVVYDGHDLRTRYAFSSFDWDDDRRRRYDDVCRTIVVFEDYGRYDPWADILWWDLMAPPSLRGDFLSEVQSRDRLLAAEHGTAALLENRGSPAWITRDAS